MCTKENLTEVQRAIHLLKKGYEMQKISVSCRSTHLQVISGLNRFMREGGANEDLLSLILVSGRGMLIRAELPRRLGRQNAN